MPVGYKHRWWQAFLSISASGPEFSPELEGGGRFLRPRMAADLRYTTSDVDYLEKSLRRHDTDRPVKDEVHRRLRNPTLREVLFEITSIGAWLSNFKNDPEWDGGAIQLCFAGHGRESDGAIVLSDGELTPFAFADELAKIARRISSPERLRVSVILDSCHSGAFITALLDLCFNRYEEYLIPFDLFASCMHDEYAWEESTLGHGLFTYCMSVKTLGLDSLAADAVQPNNTLGPSLAIAGGEFGCALLTAGSQNPLGYWNGTGHIEVSRKSVALFGTDEKCPTADEIRYRLAVLRDALRDTLYPLRGSLPSFCDGQSDDELRKAIRGDVAFLKRSKREFEDV